MDEKDIIEHVSRCYWYHIDGKKIPDESAMVAKLLDENVLFVSNNTYANTDDVLRGKTLTLFINCNDVFAWAASDCENITLEELPRFFELYEQNKDCGPIVWVCKKRNQKPQKSIVEWLKLKGGWNDDMENLADNKHELFLKQRFGVNLVNTEIIV